MRFTLLCCVGYCFAMTIVCGHYSFNTTSFTGSSSGTTCLATTSSNLPSLTGGTDVSLRMQQMMVFGFVTHLVGMFADAAMVLRVTSKNEQFNIAALIAVSIYTLAFLIWLIWI